VGVTTVIRIRDMGFDVVPTTGEMWHATVAVLKVWTQEEAEKLSELFEPVNNPTSRTRS
jgi:hypothetical protein